MKTLIAVLAVAALAACPAVAQPAQDRPLAALKTVEAAVEANAASAGGFSLDGSRGAPGLLERQWAAARRWAADWLQRHPGASPAALEAAAKNQAGLQLFALRLDGRSLLLGVNADPFGTAFILRRAAGGRYLTALALDEPGTWGGGGPEALGSWRSDRADGCLRLGATPDRRLCGPMAVSGLALLPNEPNGARRFALAGRYVKGAGATDGYQVSIWRWTGRTAQPLLLHALAQMADDPVIARTQAAGLVVREKGNFKRLYACGACEGRQVEVHIDLAGSGARLAGERSLTPELDRIDDLYDRLFRGEPVEGLASAQAIVAATKATRTLVREAAHDKVGPRLGMLMAWKAGMNDGRRTVCLETDGLDQAQRFTFAGKDATGQIESVDAVPAQSCSGPDARS